MIDRFQPDFDQIRIYCSKSQILLASVIWIDYDPFSTKLATMIENSQISTKLVEIARFPQNWQLW